MNIWAIADLHLSFGIPNKSMEVFGPDWAGWTDKLEHNWKTLVKEEDLVLLPGDISWAKEGKDVEPDLKWIDSMPGTKVMVKGNHDYWWGSLSKIQPYLPSSIHLVQNNVFNFQGISVAGARLWDTPEFNFEPYIVMTQGTPAKEGSHEVEGDEKIYLRELQRLEMSLKMLNPKADLRICMTHYPPIGPDLKPSRASVLLEKYKVDICVFGHLHSVKRGSLPYGEKNGVQYHLISGDYLEFIPKKIY